MERTIRVFVALWLVQSISGNQSGEDCATPTGWKRVLATVRYLAIQLNPVQQPVMAYGIVPITAIHQNCQVTIGKSKLPFDFTRSRLSFLTPESRDRSFSGENHLFRLAVGTAASGVSHKCQLRRS